PDGPLLQLPQARGHPLGRRARLPLRGRPARHPQLRRQVDRRGQGQAALHGPGPQGQPARVRPEPGRQHLGHGGDGRAGRRRELHRRPGRRGLRRDRAAL
ncbi:MAG: DNA-directed RNA polymerase alpha subunit, partial [uncultured Frankineae bacterium]